MTVRPRINLPEKITTDMFVETCINALVERRQWVNLNNDLEGFAVGFHAALGDLGYDVSAVDIKLVIPQLKTRVQEYKGKAA
jgi:hypothetical protein